MDNKSKAAVVLGAALVAGVVARSAASQSAAVLGLSAFELALLAGVAALVVPKLAQALR